MLSTSLPEILDRYDAVFLDCDGVVLDSNRLKTEAFRAVALPYGAEIADRFVAFHRQNGGISRYEKFASLFGTLLGRQDYEASCRAAIAEYAAIVSRGLLTCPEVPGVRHLLSALAARSVPVVVVSGSDEEELRGVFKARGLDRHVHAVFGSPRKKADLVEAALQSLPSAPSGRVLLCGDSRVDFEVASRYGFDFLMVYGYSEWEEWQEVLPSHCPRIRDFSELGTP